MGKTGLKVSDLYLGATGWRLNAEQMARLTEASEKALPYPYVFIVGTPAGHAPTKPIHRKDFSRCGNSKA